MLDRFLRGEEQPKDIHVEVFVELFLGDLFKWRPVVNSGVVDQDIDLAEGLLCCGKESFDFRLLGDVRLYGDRFAAALCDFVNDAIGAFFGGRVIDDDGCTFSRKLFCDVGADSFRRTGYDCDFSCKFSIFHCVPFIWLVLKSLFIRCVISSLELVAAELLPLRLRAKIRSDLLRAVQPD